MKPPKFHFNQRVRGTSGFYNGSYGTVVGYEPKKVMTNAEIKVHKVGIWPFHSEIIEVIKPPRLIAVNKFFAVRFDGQLDMECPVYLLENQIEKTWDE
jgi:hypothetical protein